MAVSLQVSNFFNSFSRRRQISKQSGPIRLQPGPIATPAHHVTMSTSTLRANCAWIWRQNGYYAILGDVINHVQVTSEQDCSATQAATSEPPKQPPLELPKQPPLSKTAATSELPKQPPLSYSSSHLWATKAATSELPNHSANTDTRLAWPSDCTGEPCTELRYQQIQRNSLLQVPLSILSCQSL